MLAYKMECGYRCLPLGKGKRNYEFRKIYVDKDYSDPGTQIGEAYKDKLKIIKTLRNIRENKFNYNSKQKKAVYV
jgi:hypothetical protein